MSNTIKNIGCIVGKGKVLVDPDKIDAIRSRLTPTFIKEVY